MAPLRLPLQGLWNVVRFNWHFYLFSLGAALAMVLVYVALPGARPYAALALVLLLAPMVISLVATAWVYDFSGLYQLSWLSLPGPAPAAVLTLSAGFDEISALLQHKYAPRQLQALDFYDPTRHTEVSIRRARRAYPPFPGTRAVDTRAALPLPAESFDLAVAFLAAHEIRDASERAVFFQEIRRVTRPDGLIVVTEHLRDTANFLAYSIGCLHFHSRRAWLRTFQSAGLQVLQEVKVTPLISAFILGKDGAAA